MASTNLSPLERIYAALDETKDLKVDALVRSDLPNVNFEGFRPNLAQALFQLDLLRGLDLSMTPPQALAEAAGAVEGLAGRLLALLTFDPMRVQAAPIVIRDQLQAKIYEVLSNYYGHIAVPLAVGMRRAVAAAQLDSLSSGLREKHELALSELQGLQREGQKALEALRAASADSALAVQANHFEDERRSHDATARRWLYSTFCFAACTALFALQVWLSHPYAEALAVAPTQSQMLASVPPPPSAPAPIGLGATSLLAIVVNGLLPRLVVLSMLVYGLALSAKNLRIPANVNSEIAAS